MIFQAFQPHSLGPCLSLCGGLLRKLSPSVFDCFSRIAVLEKEDARLSCVSAGCFGTFFNMSLAGDVLLQSFKHTWWYNFVVLPAFVVTFLWRTLHITVCCSTSSLLYPNHRQMMDPELFFWELISLLHLSISPAAPATWDRCYCCYMLLGIWRCSHNRMWCT